MKIGIDIDDVIVDTSLTLKKHFLEFEGSIKLIPYIVEIMRGEVPDIAKEFIEKNIVKILSLVTLKENSVNIINKLIEEGNQIYIITSRGEKQYKGSEKLTLEFLKNNNIKFDKIFFNSLKKADICKESNIDILIDDSVKYCEEFEAIGGISILFTSIVNKNISTNVQRTNNWLDLYEKINNLKGKIYG